MRTVWRCTQTITTERETRYDRGKCGRYRRVSLTHPEKKDLGRGAFPKDGPDAHQSGQHEEENSRSSISFKAKRQGVSLKSSEPTT